MHAKYVILNAAFLLPLLLALALYWRQVAKRLAVKTLAIMCLLTAIFDNIMIAAGIMTYNQHQILGIKIGLAPLEDFAYTLAAVLLVAVLWGRATKS